MTDLLTGLDSRHQLHLRLPELAARANLARPLALLLLKIKDFSLWQSKLTPLAADRLLTISAELLRQQAPAQAVTARWGGATFALLLPDCPLWKAEALAEELRQAAAAQTLPAIFCYEGLSLDFHYGCATLPPQGIWQLSGMAEADLRRAEGGAFFALSTGKTATPDREIMLKLGRSLLAQNGSYLSRHSMLCCSLALATGHKIGLDAEALADLELAAVFADIALGEAAGQALEKPGPLTFAEYRRIQRHPGFAAQLCTNLHLPPTVIDAVLYHHERPDGLGYPEGLRSPEIPRAAAILSAAGVYAALLLPRPYRPARRPLAARAEFNLLAGKAVDAEIARHLLEIERSAKDKPVG